MSKLDEIDRRILRELQQDGRLSNAALAEKVGLSATPCWRRVKRLEDEGYILGYVALVNPQKVGLADSVFAQVTLEKHQGMALASFGEEVQRMPEVLDAFVVAGEADYWLRVAVPNSAGYEQFLSQKLLKVPGVSHVHSAYVLKQVKYMADLPIPSGEDE